MSAAGVTAINFTINDVGNGANKFMAAVKNIAEIEHELVLHPDVLRLPVTKRWFLRKPGF